MRRPARWSGLIGLPVLAAMASPCLSLAGEPLQPYQLVRSLQLVQDRIAAGDHAALPMQAKLLEMTDARLRAASADIFAEPRNFRALLVYGMSGGNPVTVEVTTSRLELDAQNRSIANGIVDYLRGRPADAIEALSSVDPMQLPNDLGAFLALVKGSLLAAEHPNDALPLLDKARLLSPGTLVEEAALRRSVAIAGTQGDAARFALASTQYVERYLHSPYASQFADAFVSGVIALHQAISQDKLADITSMMDGEREKVIYLRIARHAAIEGLNDLSAFASERAEKGRDGGKGDPRAELYASLSTVTSAAVEDLHAKLTTIDRSRLSASDQSLLDAVQAVAKEMIAPPAGVKPPPTAPKAPPALKASTEKPATGETDLPVVEGMVEENPAPTAVPPAAPAQAASPAETALATTPADPTDASIADARRRLEGIDQLLGASPQ